MLLTRSPLRSPVLLRDPPFDLHVLSTPPAFILSQDQTLRKKNLSLFRAFDYGVKQTTGVVVFLPITFQLLRFWQPSEQTPASSWPAKVLREKERPTPLSTSARQILHTFTLWRENSLEFLSICRGTKSFLCHWLAYYMQAAFFVKGISEISFSNFFSQLAGDFFPKGLALN